MATAQRVTQTARTPSDPQRAEARPRNRNLFKTGDRLEREEFERRYALMPHIKKAELIEGMVVMEEHVHYDAHGNPHARLIGWLTTTRGTRRVSRSPTTPRFGSTTPTNRSQT